MKGEEWLNSFKGQQGLTSIDWEAVEDLKNIIEENEILHKIEEITNTLESLKDDIYPWILCSKRNPTKKGYYLVTRGYKLSNGDYSIWVPESAYFRGNKWAKEDVIAWCPLENNDNLRKFLNKGDSK